MSAWQSIDSAPRDGTEVLAYFDKSRIYIVLSWGASMLPDRAFAWVDDDGVPNGTPSHWMRLPEPPVSGLESSSEHLAKHEQE